MNCDLKMSVVCLLEEVLRDPDLLPQERKATANILRFFINYHKIGYEISYIKGYHLENVVNVVQDDNVILTILFLTVSFRKMTRKTRN